ncbi:MAG: hypothetical protein WCL28_02715 [bacterium]
MDLLEIFTVRTRNVMALPQSVEALINERTGKYFVVLEWGGSDDGKIKVINPNGDVLDVPSLIFKVDDPRTVEQSKFSEVFSPSQIAKLETWQSDQYAVAERQRLQRAARVSQTSSSKPSAPRPRAGSSRTEGLIDRKQSSASRRPTVQWSADTLVFYRHKIENLKPNDVFAIVIEGRGTLQMTKAEFQRNFNNIIMSPEYRTQGIYRYQEIPDEALPFIK